MKFLSKRQKDEEVYKYFLSLRENGRTIMEATYACMEKFSIATTVTINNIRKRMEDKV